MTPEQEKEFNSITPNNLRKAIQQIVSNGGNHFAFINEKKLARVFKGCTATGLGASSQQVPQHPAAQSNLRSTSSSSSANSYSKCSANDNNNSYSNSNSNSDQSKTKKQFRSPLEFFKGIASMPQPATPNVPVPTAASASCSTINQIDARNSLINDINTAFDLRNIFRGMKMTMLRSRAIQAYLRNQTADTLQDFLAFVKVSNSESVINELREWIPDSDFKNV